MDTKTIDVQKVVMELNELLSLLQFYPEIVLTQGDKPVARLSAVEPKPIAEKRERIPGLHQGQGWISNDFTNPLPDEFWLDEEKRL